MGFKEKLKARRKMECNIKESGKEETKKQIIIISQRQ